MDPQLFQHEPIDTKAQQIRLITILPTANGILRCRIKAFDLGDKPTPDYRALSYTWGPPSPVQAIEVNNKLFMVRQNLYDFMNNFRARLVKFAGDEFFKEEVQWLWIDQICIDQTTTQERNHQVEMMSEIYRRASYVYLWLGASNDNTANVIRALKTNFRLYHHRRERARLNTDIKTSITDQESPSLSEDDLWTFFENPYWGRLWIVQEIMLARYIRIICGDSLVSWEELSRFCTTDIDFRPYERFQEFTRDITYPIPKQLRWLAENALTGKTFSFSVLFDIFGDNLCEDPSDKVYALLGIVHPAERVKVDYEKPSKNKFIEAAKLILSGKPQSHPDLFKVVQAHDIEKSLDKIFMNAAMAMMNEARQETGLRLMDAMLTLASQMHVKLPYEHDKEAAEARDDELKNRWTDLAQAYAALYTKVEGEGEVKDQDPIWNTRSDTSVFLANEYKKVVEMTISFFDMLLVFLNWNPPQMFRLDFRWRTQNNLLRNLDVVRARCEQSQ
ncbi:HET-domain-containing protein [Stipitochalara longipes BDJ]|nr:HET-domain-containing protein [Stipitochalara longipes BDJ]